jgi:ATP adenylyltransferase
MDQIFAPWRIDWVERAEPNAEFDECIFCEVPERDEDRDHLLVARADDAFLMLNNYPYNPGHAMVIPLQHTGEYTDLDESSLLAKERLLQCTIDAMDEAFDPDGYNVGYNLGGGAAGGSVGDHIHAHVVPRWDGDTNFMPTVSDTKVIVEAVEDTYDRLHAAIAEVEGATDPGEGAAVRLDLG